MQTPHGPMMIFVIVALATLSACGQRQQAPLPRAQEVAVITLQHQGLELTTELPGRTSPYLVSEFRPQANGIIQKRLFAEGTDIKAAQVSHLGIVVGTHSNSSAFFDEYQCRSDCAFRHNIKRDFAGHVMLPFDSRSRIGYEKCLEDCQQKSFNSEEESE